ncbi:MAG: hydroxymethylglutaryl-CoA lyase [Actinomycetota bacterium]
MGPRDGLQNEDQVLAPVVRAELVDRLAAAGLGQIEAVSAVDSRRVPAMAGAEEVLSAITRRSGTRYGALVLNERGYQRLADSKVDEVRFAFAASEEFNQRNQNATPDESFAVGEHIVALAHADGRTAGITIATSFGCPFEGSVDAGRVLDFAERAAATGADEIVFADTVGVAVPTQVSSMVTKAISFGAPVGVHLHNTRNTGYVNAWAALEAGATGLDSSVGGLGGCPFAPHATGNVATEDLVYLLHGEGISTGVDLEALLEVTQWLEQVMGKSAPGQLHSAGIFDPVASGDAVRALRQSEVA